MFHNRPVDVAADIHISGDVRLSYELGQDNQVHFIVGDGCDLHFSLDRDCLPQWIATMSDAQSTCGTAQENDVSSS